VDFSRITWPCIFCRYYNINYDSKLKIIERINHLNNMFIKTSILYYIFILELFFLIELTTIIIIDIPMIVGGDMLREMY